jgi:periplasmic divalent cation tolerance protein
MAAVGINPRIVFVMAGGEDEAAKIARSLVDERIAACVNIVGPVRSLYRWRGEIEDEKEYLLIIKSRAQLFPKLERRVKELHSYEVPEVVAVAMSRVSKPYLDWLVDSTAERPPRARKLMRRKDVATS